MGTTEVTSVFVILGESRCASDGKHETMYSVAKTEKDAMKKILTTPHGDNECDCDFSDEEVDETKISCLAYPMVIREMSLSTGKEISKRKFLNESQVSKDALDMIPSLVDVQENNN